MVPIIITTAAVTTATIIAVTAAAVSIEKVAPTKSHIIFSSFLSTWFDCSQVSA